MSLILAGLCVPAFGQSLSGEYEMIGRRCEDSGKMAPPDDSTLTVVFTSGGSFRYDFFKASGNDIEKMEEILEKERARYRRYFEEDKQTHEKVCREQGMGAVFDEEGNIDLCEPSNKRKLYARWKRERRAEADEMIAELEEEIERQEDAGPCSMSLEGRYEASGNRLVIFPQDFSASESCGEQSYPKRLAMTYYFDGPYLYLVNPANDSSREYCSRSDWAEIYLRQ